MDGVQRHLFDKDFVVHCANFHVALRALKCQSSLIKADSIMTVTFRFSISIFPSPGQDWLFCPFITTLHQVSVTCHKLAMQGCIHGIMFCHRFTWKKSQKILLQEQSCRKLSREQYPEEDVGKREGLKQV